MAKMEVLHLTPTERGELQSYLRKRNLPASVAQRMRIVLLLDEGTSYRDIEEKLGAAPSTVSRWKQRYEKDGVLGLATIHPGQPPQKLTPQLRARVLERTRQAPPDGSTHWSLRKMAAVMKVNKNLIARIWKEADLKPRRLERYMASNDPQFEEKAAAIIGLYLNPPQNAAVFCVDEKSAIQALDRLDRRIRTARYVRMSTSISSTRLIISLRLSTPTLDSITCKSSKLMLMWAKAGSPWRIGQA